MQCPEAHLFCTSCVTTYAETQLGSQDARLTCMDQSGCKLPFPESELRRFLTPKLLELYKRVKQRKEIEAAGLEGLEECPFCEYKVVIENDQERLFRCENEACAAVTCRQCKKLVRVFVPDAIDELCGDVRPRPGASRCWHRGSVLPVGAPPLGLCRRFCLLLLGSAKLTVSLFVAARQDHLPKSCQGTLTPPTRGGAQRGGE